MPRVVEIIPKVNRELVHLEPLCVPEEIIEFHPLALSFEGGLGSLLPPDRVGELPFQSPAFQAQRLDVGVLLGFALAVRPNARSFVRPLPWSARMS